MNENLNIDANVVIQILSAKAEEDPLLAEKMNSAIWQAAYIEAIKKKEEEESLPESSLSDDS